MIEVKGEIKVTKDDLAKFMKRVSSFKEAYVTIGIHKDAGAYPGKDPVSVFEVALFQEFGTHNIPSRSFLRSAVNENTSKINEWREEAIVNVLEKGWTVKKALEMIGLRVQILVQNKIKSNVPPPLAKSTADAKMKKGRAPVTLIDTGLLLRSITYKVYAK